MSKKVVLLKLTGEILKGPDGQLDKSLICSVADQMKTLSADYYFGIVVGGGNFFRGSVQGKALGLSSSVGHQVGMLATMMNGLIIKDIFEHHHLSSTLFCAVPASEVGIPISHQSITNAMQNDKCPIFTGGTGNPFFTTDTTAILRGLQIGASEVWKGTHVDGIYSDDPRKNPNAQFIQKITYEQAFAQRLKIMDATAFALAMEHSLPIRVFNLFEKNSLIKASKDPQFGSIITKG